MSDTCGVRLVDVYTVPYQCAVEAGHRCQAADSRPCGAVSRQRRFVCVLDYGLFERSQCAVPAAVKNFTIIYVEMGMARMTPDEKLPLAQKLVSGFADRVLSQRLAIFHILLPVRSFLPLPMTLRPDVPV